VDDPTRLPRRPPGVGNPSGEAGECQQGGRWAYLWITILPPPSSVDASLSSISSIWLSYAIEPVARSQILMRKQRAAAALATVAALIACGDASMLRLGPPDGIPPVAPPPGVPAPAEAGPPPACSAFPEGFVVSFEDEILEALVRAALGVGPEKPLTCGLVAGLTQLGAGHAGIESIGGIENLMGLTRLDLGFNPQLADLRPLRHLTALTSLHVGNAPSSGLPGGGPITDLAPLGALTNLTYLSVRGGSVSDLAPLSALVSLEGLNLSYNSISDLGPLTDLTSLSIFYVVGNQVVDLSPLSNLTGLRILWIGDNPVAEYSPLSGLTNIEQLVAYRTLVSDISALEFLTNASRFTLFGNGSLSDISPLIDNVGLGSGDRVSLQSTSVSCVDVALLEAKGVTVSSDCS
jgi:Leucine-rich repeat (LRR) protein